MYMKHDFYILNSDFALGEVISRWPLFDVEFNMATNLPVTRMGKFTGIIYNWLYLSVCLFRYKFVFTMQYRTRDVGPKEAERMYRERNN